MAAEISIEALGGELRNLLDRLHSGESVTVVGADGQPVARLVSLKGESRRRMSAEEWEARWDALAERISKAWKGNRNAVEAVAEQRR